MDVTYEHLFKESESDKWYLDEDDGVGEKGGGQSWRKVKVSYDDLYL